MKASKREVTQLSDTLSKIGGLITSMLLFFSGVYAFFYKPFHELNLAITFQRIRQKMNEEHEQKLPIYLTRQHIKSMDNGFYLRYFCFQRCICCFNKLLKKHRSSDVGELVE